MAQKVIVAAGIEIRDSTGLVTFLNANADSGKGSVWTFPKGAGAAKATHEVSVVFTLAEFTAALEVADAYVIYDGHSRYGQGPAFGPSGTVKVPDKKTFPVNPWGVHFRMGYDATDTECIDDLVEHSVTPGEYDLTAAAAKAFLPGALKTAATNAIAVEKQIAAGTVKKTKRCSTPGAWRLLDDCEAALAATTTARGDQPLKGRHYYARKVGARGKQKPPDEYLTAVKVGSTDLNSSSLKGKVLFLGSCSSHVHFFEALDRRRTAVKSTCLFYLTGNVCSADHGRNFIEQVFKGVDPTSAKGKKTMKAKLNGFADAGAVGFY